MLSDFNNGNDSSLINLSPQQKQYVDDTNKMFESLINPISKDYQQNGGGFWDWMNTFANMFNIGGKRDLELQDWNRKVDIMLENTAIRRRVADALQSGVNPIFALGVNGAGSGNVASQPSGNKSSMLNSLLKILFGLTFLLK